MWCKKLYVDVVHFFLVFFIFWVHMRSKHGPWTIEKSNLGLHVQVQASTDPTNAKSFFLCSIFTLVWTRCHSPQHLAHHQRAMAQATQHAHAATITHDPSRAWSTHHPRASLHPHPTSITLYTTPLPKPKPPQAIKNNIPQQFSRNTWIKRKNITRMITNIQWNVQYYSFMLFIFCCL